MALIKCPECGKKVSNQAQNCPNCGHPIATTDPVHQIQQTIPQTPQHTKKQNRGCLIPMLILILIFGGSLVFGLLYEYQKQKDGLTESVDSVDVTGSSEETKQNAKAADKQLWDYVLPIINSHNQLMEIIQNDSSTNLDIYNAAKTFKDMCQQTWGNPPEVSGNGTKEYLNSCKDYIIIEQTMSDSLLKYLDSSKTSDLSKVQENIQSCTQALSILASNRGTFLSQNGFSSEEIQEIISDLGISE